jgi:predicted thioesterase
MEPPAASADLSFDVTADDTAVALGSGSVDVLATPRLLAWFEAATCAAADAAGLVGAGRTTVGTRVTVEHLLATPVGGHVRAHAELLHADGRLLRFSVAAVDGAERAVARGEVTRVVVDLDRFRARVPSP